MSKSIIGGEAQRPKIFDEWPKRPLTFNTSISKQVQRSNKRKQSLRAQQLLHKSLMLLVNIRSFLSQKDKTLKKYHEYAQQSDIRKKKLEQMTTQSKKSYNQKEYQNELEKYYCHIREQSRYQRQSEAFVLANLKNFNSKVTAVKLTRDDINECHKQLDKRLNKIASDRSFLQSSLVIYEQDDPQSQIVPSYNFQKILEQLNKETSGQDLQAIHYLMLYQLEQLSTQNEKFHNVLTSDKQSYKIYEAISDSMSLMTIQKQQMKTDIQKMKSSCKNLTISNSSQIVPISHNSLLILQKNEKIYDANMQLFARYNAQTDLNQYAQRRKQYANQLDVWKKSYRKWLKAEEISYFLYSRQEMMNRYCKRLELGDNNVNMRVERDDIKNAYYDCLNCQVPERFDSIRRYRLALIQDLGTTLEKSGILLPERQNLLKSSQNRMLSSVDLHRQQQKFHKHLHFFIQLSKQPNPQKSQYLSLQQNKIKALKYELSVSKSASSEIAVNYQIDLDYCQAIAQHQRTNDHKKYLERVEEIRKKRWMCLPIGIDSLAFYYSMDVLLKDDCQYYMDRGYSGYLENMGKEVLKEIQMKGFQQDLDDPTTEYPYRFFNIPVQERRKFFFTYYRKISDYSPTIKTKLLQKYWKKAEAYLFSPYMRNSNGSYEKIEVSKKNFFTFRTLGYLCDESSRIKLSNYSELIQYYIEYLSKYIVLKWSQAQIFLEIVKQRVFLNFLKNKVMEKQNLYTEFQVLSKIHEACNLLYESKDHQNLCDSDDLQTHMQHSIRLHKDWLQNTLQINPTQKISLQQKCRAFLNQVRKSPLIVGTKVSLQSYQQVVNIPNNIKKLDKIKNIPPSMNFLSAVYVRCNSLLEALDSFSQHQQFSSSDLLMVRDRNDKKLYLDKVEANAKKQLNFYKSHLIRVLSLYKGKHSDVNGTKIVKSISEDESKFFEIIEKLQSTRGKNDTSLQFNA